MKGQKLAKTPRATLAKRIRVAPGNRAQEIAFHGRELSPIERAAHQYLFWRRCDAEGNYNEENRPHKIEDELNERAANVLGLVLDAIDKKDDTTIHKLADFVKAWTSDRSGVDERRSLLLAAKKALNSRGAAWTLSELSLAMRWPNGADLAHLRRLARELNFPLRKDRVGRRKIRTNKRGNLASRS